MLRKSNSLLILGCLCLSIGSAGTGFWLGCTVSKPEIPDCAITLEEEFVNQVLDEQAKDLSEEERDGKPLPE